MANKKAFVARVVVGEHATRVFERWLDGDQEPDDDLRDIALVERRYPTREEKLAYEQGVIDTADEYRVLSPAEYVRFRKATR